MGITHEKTIVVIHGKADDLLEMDVSSVVNETDFLAFRAEDEDSPDVRVGYVNVAPGVDCYTVRLDQNVWMRSPDLIDLSLAGEPIHPLLLFLRRFRRIRRGGFTLDLSDPADARDVWRTGPDQLAHVDFRFRRFRFLLGRLRSLFLLVRIGIRHRTA